MSGPWQTMTCGDADPAAVVTLTRTAVHKAGEPTLAELHHSDAPHTP